MEATTKWPANNPIKWADFLEALSKKDHIPEWPLLSKTISTQNCDICSRQFVSSINYRRHTLIHDRTSDKDKELAGDRDLLHIYWDTISNDEFKSVVSFKKLSLKDKEESVDAIVKRLESFIQKPRVILPGAYVKAGNSLLDVVRSRPTKERIKSVELFKILNDASEQTFLCSVIDDSVRTHVFEGDDKISLENLVACICFLLEQNLVEHWNRHRIAQSLVDEEENEKQRQQRERERQRQQQRERERQHQQQRERQQQQQQEQEHRMQQERQQEQERERLRQQEQEWERLRQQEQEQQQQPQRGRRRRRQRQRQRQRQGQQQQQERNERKTRNEVMEHESKEGGDENASKYPTETSTSASCHADEDFRGEVAQACQLSKAEVLFDAEKDNNGGPNENKVSTESDQKDSEARQEEQKVKEIQTRQANQKKENKNKGQMQNASIQTDTKKNQEGNRGDASDTLWSTGTSTPDSPLATEGSPTQVAQLVHVPDASQISDAEKEGEFKQKEEISQEQKSQDKNFQGMVNTSDSLQSGEIFCGGASETPIWTQVKQRDNLSDPLQFCDAEKGGLEQKAETAEERKGEDEIVKEVEDASALLHSGKTLSCSSRSENLIDAQATHPDQSLFPLKAVAISDAKKAADAECSQEGQETTSQCEIVSTPVQSHCVEKRATPGTTILKFGEFELDGSCTNTASTSGGRKGTNTASADHTNTASTSGGREDTDNAAVVPLADDLDNINKAKEEVVKAWEHMVTKLHELWQRQQERARQ